MMSFSSASVSGIVGDSVPLILCRFSIRLRIRNCKSPILNGLDIQSSAPAMSDFFLSSSSWSCDVSKMMGRWLCSGLLFSVLVSCHPFITGMLTSDMMMSMSRFFTTSRAFSPLLAVKMLYFVRSICFISKSNSALSSTNSRLEEFLSSIMSSSMLLLFINMSLALKSMIFVIGIVMLWLSSISDDEKDSLPIGRVT